MKLTVFGATRKTGRLLTQHAFAKGHEVVAYARNPAKLGIQDSRLKIIQGELDNVVYSYVRICKWINLILYVCVRAKVRLGSI